MRMPLRVNPSRVPREDNDEINKKYHRQNQSLVCEHPRYPKATVERKQDHQQQECSDTEYPWKMQVLLHQAGGSGCDHGHDQSEHRQVQHLEYNPPSTKKAAEEAAIVIGGVATGELEAHCEQQGETTCGNCQSQQSAEEAEAGKIFHYFTAGAVAAADHE